MRNRTSLVALLLLISLVAPVATGGTLPPTAASPGVWIQLPNSPRAGFNIGRHDDLWFVDALTGWVVNGNGQVWHTSDGGDSWTLQTYTSAYNRCVSFTDAQHGWIGLLYPLNGASILRTVDGGLTWQPVELPEPKPEGMCGMQALNANTICAVGAYYGTPRFVRTDDGGQTWTVRDMSDYCGALVDTWWFDSQNGIAVGSTGPGPGRLPLVLRTWDGGVTWSVRWTGTRTKELCWKISFVDSTVGFVSIENLNSAGPCYFLKTSDSGLTWSERLFSPDYLNCQGIGFVNEYYGWIGGWEIGTSVTRDGGDTWSPINFGYNVNRIRFLSPQLGYAVGQDVYKFMADPSGVGDGEPPAGVSLLSQNQPNPFPNRTTISYRVEEAGRVTLRLFDSQGRPVRDLFRGERGPGDYTQSFDATGLAAGTYYYELRTPSGSRTKKLQVTR